MPDAGRWCQPLHNPLAAPCQLHAVVRLLGGEALAILYLLEKALGKLRTFLQFTLALTKRLDLRLKVTDILNQIALR
jgi:hypothetical protein